MMTSTIENLPPEMLVEIFSHYIKSEGHVAFSLLAAPVCKTWWDVSLTPSLYKSFQVENWNYARSVCERGLLYLTQSLELPARGIRRRPCLIDSSHLSTILSSINDLKSLEISNYDIDVNTMMIVAEHCPNLERLIMTGVESGEYGQIRLEELSPILNICGPKMKLMSFRRCCLGDIKQLFTEISSKCKSLEALELSNSSLYLQNHDRNMFPIHKFASGCPRLRKLELTFCKIDATDGNYCSGFEYLTVFKADKCYSHGLDVCCLLKSSTNLEQLELCFVDSLVWSDVSKIPSNNLKFLSMYCSVNDIDTNLKAVKEAVDKWKHTLLHLQIFSQSGDLTNILRTYLNNNPCPKLEELLINEGCVDPGFFKIFIQECHNLNELCILKKNLQLKTLINRKNVVEFMHSI